MLSHGLSEGPAPKSIPTYRHLVADARQFVFEVAGMQPETYFAFVSHSTGGAVCLHLTADMTPADKVGRGARAHIVSSQLLSLFPAVHSLPHNPY